MLSSRRLVIPAAIVLSIAYTFTASAASKHYRATHAHSGLYNMVPDTRGGCTASGGPACSGACLPSGPPCAPTDVW
jgi:hypothetical protein